MEKSEKSEKLESSGESLYEKCIKDPSLVTIKEVDNMFISSACSLVRLRNILPVVKAAPNKNLKPVYFYDRESLISAMSNYTDNVFSKKFITLPDLIKSWNIKESDVYKILKKNKINPWRVCKKEQNKVAVYSRSICEKIMPFIIQENTEKEPKPMQTPDFIPADTLDIYTIDQLKAKIPGIENHYEMFNKSEVPEYQEIARMLRGNQKSVNLWGKVVEGIKNEVGAAVEVAPMYDENIKRFTVPDKYFVQNTDRLMTYREVSILLKESVGSLRNKVSCLSLKPTIINRKAYFNTNQVEMMRGKTVTDIKKDRLTELEEKVSELEQIVVKLKNCACNKK